MLRGMGVQMIGMDWERRLSEKDGLGGEAK
jgi:hypothetical protein